MYPLGKCTLIYLCMLWNKKTKRVKKISFVFITCRFHNVYKLFVVHFSFVYSNNEITRFIGVHIKFRASQRNYRSTCTHACSFLMQYKLVHVYLEELSNENTTIIYAIG